MWASPDLHRLSSTPTSPGTIQPVPWHHLMLHMMLLPCRLRTCSPSTQRRQVRVNLSASRLGLLELQAALDGCTRPVLSHWALQPNILLRMAILQPPVAHLLPWILNPGFVLWTQQYTRGRQHHSLKCLTRLGPMRGEQGWSWPQQDAQARGWLAWPLTQRYSRSDCWIVWMQSPRNNPTHLLLVRHKLLSL